MATSRDYWDAYQGFSLHEEEDFLFCKAHDFGINAYTECCGRYAVTDPERAALLYIDVDGNHETYSYGRLEELTGKFANLLVACGVQAGDRVAALLPRTPELLVAILGTLRLGAVYQPLFTAFGSRAVEQRLGGSGAKVVVVDAMNRSKLDKLTRSFQIVSVGIQGSAVPSSDMDFWKELGRQSSHFEPVQRSKSDGMLFMSTSGTTGSPKSLEVPIKAIISFMAYLRNGADLRPDDKWWNVADPGWAFGLYIGVLGTLALGQRTLFFNAPFTAESTIRIIKEHGITNLAGSPTAFRLIMAGGEELVKPVKGQLRAVSSGGEPLNSEIIRWFADYLDVTVHDHYGQTEMGMVICHHHGLEHPVHPGATGFPSPGYRLAILDDDGNELPCGVPGVLAVDRRSSPLFWFTGYAGAAMTSEDAYFRSGDIMERNSDGSISFVGRSDDVITSSGYRIGPFDVESCLLEHPAVVDSAVVGKRDQVRTEIVKAFVVLHPSHLPSDRLIDELQQHVRARLSSHSYPREITFVQQLPKTPSGKVQRFVLRQMENDQNP
ncbi:AMP-binding protein [Sphingobium xenophagum]|uniref:AMP-binding protein n=1 Tax=Sphingobium xenophagum TaxID=121428 RepID=UPI0003685046|nr:AMP-binding protein [Sphingobium xenophagum]